ncbi:hypothetical protein AMTRI_Chr08g166530 [Amborella trichopoda]
MASVVSCSSEPVVRALCRSSPEAFRLKVIAIPIILITSVVGVSSPVILARRLNSDPAYARLLLWVKCFAAGVILSTSFVHVMPDAFQALADCRIATHHPWRDFPFSGLVTMLGALTTLLVDLAAASSHAGHGTHYVPLEKENSAATMNTTGVAELGSVKVGCCDREEEEEGEAEVVGRGKESVVAKVLEVGIVFHSVIIGATLGMSQDQCTIRPLVAALAFHQIFEGMGLGGCIAQAGFSGKTMALMCMMFSITTPAGIILGMLVYFLTGYDDNNPKALIMEGILGSFSSGILVYMALVDLIAVDFFQNKSIKSSSKMKMASYIALVLGSASMSLLAIWA